MHTWIKHRTPQPCLSCGQLTSKRSRVYLHCAKCHTGPGAQVQHAVRGKYDVRVEPADGFNLATGAKWAGVRVRYRKLGSRGRFESFLVLDPLPDPFDPFQAVKLYEASRA